MKDAKLSLLQFMNKMGFQVVDIAYVNHQELYAEKMNCSEELVWFPIQAGGSGFEQMFKGEIKKVLD